MARYKVALIGCGWVGMGSQLDPVRPIPASHAQAIQLNDRLDLVGILDNDEQAIKVAGKLYPGAATFKDFEALCSNEIPDLVVIATHPDSHCSYIRKAVSAGVRMILCEKPISHNIDEANQVVSLCEENGVVLIVNHMRRFDPEIARVRSYINNEYVRDTITGKIRSIIASYDHGLFHGGTHIIDLLRYFMGDVRAVSAVYNLQVEAPHDDLNVDAILQFEECNAMLHFINTRECAVGEVSFIGEKGIVKLTNMWGMNIELIGTKTCPEYPVHQIPDYSNIKHIGTSRSFFEHTYKHIVNCLDNNERPLSTGSDAMETVKVMCAIAESAKQNGRVIQIS